jgi:type I restriction enzyme, S subunit
MEIEPGYQQTEVGVIPEDWGVSSANDVCELVIDCKNRTPPVIDGGDYAVVRTPNVRNGKFVYEELRYTNRESFNEWTARGVPQIGDVLITREAPLGEVCLVPSGIPVCLGQRMMLYRPNQEIIDSNYLLNALMSSGIQDNLLKKIGGSTVGHAKVDDIRFLQIALPPIKAEQEAIAEALSDADALIESLGQLIAKKRQIKQGAMQELLTGKKRLPGFSREWEEKRLGELAVFHKGKGLPKSSLAPYGKVACIHYGELFTSYPETIREIISRTNNSEDSFKSITNDVLMPTSDVTPNGLAKASCIGVSGVILGGDILVIRSDEERVNGSFLSYVIRHQEAQVLQLVTGTTVFHLYASDMRKFRLPLPTVAEQQAIVTILSDMDADIDTLEAKQSKANQIKKGMMQELLTGRIRLI